MKSYRRKFVVAAAFGLALVVPFAVTLAFLDCKSAASRETSNLHKNTHRIIFQVNSDDPAIMKHAITGSLNAIQAFNDKNELVNIEIVAYGAGIHIFRSDTSPVKDLLALLHAQNPNVVFGVCGNTKNIMEINEGHPLSLVDGARIFPSGVVRIVELQETGWSYVRP